MRFKATTTPSNTINNMKFYTDGTNSFGTGVTMTVKTATSYTDPSTVGSGQVNPFGHDAFILTSGAPLNISGSITNPSTGSFGDYTVTQMGVASTATQGTTPSETWTFRYDES